MSKHEEEQLSEIVYDTGVLLPVSASSKTTKVEVLCRIAQGMEKEWPKAAEALLTSMEGAGVSPHVCKRYLMKNGSMVYGIHVSVEAASAKQLKGALSSLVGTISPVVEQAAKPAPAPQAGAKSVMPMSYAEYRKFTSASPRPPSDPARLDPIPKGFVYKTKTIASGVNEGGKTTVIEEIPLPHVHHDMNVPNSKGKGARLTG